MANKLILTDEQEADLSVSFVTQAGNRAKVDGTPSWRVSDPAILEIVPTQDPFSVVVRRVGPVGSAQVSVTADADLGEGVRPVAAVLDVDVIAAEAVSASISAGSPRVAGV